MAEKKLNFGCGIDVKEGWDNCDVQKGKNVISFDFDTFPYPLKTGTYDLIYSRSVLQMLDRPDGVLNELWRIAKPGARIQLDVPYWHNKGAYNDIQTKHLFNEYSFIYFAEQKPCRIDTKKKFKIVRIFKRSTIVGKFIPEFIKRKLDLFIGGLYSDIEVEFEVIK